jgi:hypothetical protein
MNATLPSGLGATVALEKDSLLLKHACWSWALSSW